MKNLVLLRHGIAVPHGTPDVEETERPLTSAGRNRTLQVVKRLRHILKKVDVVLTSPLPRAIQTAEIAVEVLGLQDRLEITDELLPGAEPQAIRTFLESRPESRVLVVGHNPNLSDLLNLLITGSPQSGVFELRKSGTASVRQEEDGRYRLDWFLRPRIIRGLD